MKKILIINSLYYPNITGGAERSVQLLAEGLKNAGLEPVIISTAETDSVEYVNGIRVYYLRIPNLYWMRDAKKQPPYKKPFWHLIDSYNPTASSRLTGIILTEKPDLVHTNNLAGFSVAAWSAAKKQGIPIVHTIRDHYLLCPNSTMYKNDRNCDTQCLSCELYSLPRKTLSALVDAVVGVSRFILDKHLHYGYFAKSKVKTYIYNSADITIETGNELKTDAPVTFGIIGLLAPIKGTEFLLKRFKAINPERAGLKIFGRGITQAYEKMLIERYRCDNIEFMGFKKPEEIYCEIDVAIIPSLCDDAFSRIKIEAYSHGIPVIASSMGGVPETVENGKTGFVFSPSVGGSLEKQIMKFIDDPALAERLADNCREKAKAFHIDKVVNKYIEIYTQAAG